MPPWFLLTQYLHQIIIRLNFLPNFFYFFYSDDHNKKVADKFTEEQIDGSFMKNAGQSYFLIFCIFMVMLVFKLCGTGINPIVKCRECKYI